MATKLCIQYLGLCTPLKPNLKIYPCSNLSTVSHISIVNGAPELAKASSQLSPLALLYSLPPSELEFKAYSHPLCSCPALILSNLPLLHK